MGTLSNLHLWYLLMIMHPAHLVCWPTRVVWHRPNAPLAANYAVQLCNCLAAFYRHYPQPIPSRRYFRNNSANMIAATFGHPHPRNLAYSHGAPMCWCWIQVLVRWYQYFHHLIASVWLFCQHCQDHCAWRYKGKTKLIVRLNWRDMVRKWIDHRLNGLTTCCHLSWR